jgi:predicted RNA-binding Zn-ribbon protein involved in translation (DUF1610 family)
MSSLPEKIEVACPKCGEEYAAWDRSSFDPATSSSCPNCGYEMVSDQSLRSDGAWQSLVEEPETPER